jgi:hypothetical protein
MGLGSMIAAAVDAARAATESLQVEVVHEAWLGQNALGAPSGYDAPVSRLALVQEGRQQHQALDGRVLTVRAIVTFFPESEGLAPPALKAQDRLTLPSGLTGPIAEIRDTLVGPGTGAPYVRTAWLA